MCIHRTSKYYQYLNANFFITSSCAGICYKKFESMILIDKEIKEKLKKC